MKRKKIVDGSLTHVPRTGDEESRAEVTHPGRMFGQVKPLTIKGR